MSPRNSTKRRKSVLLALGWYVHEINIGVAKYARESGWILQDIISRSGIVPSGWNGDGIITLLPDWGHRPLIEFVKKAKVPVVNLSDQLPELPFPRVLPDNIAIGRLAAEDLIGRGLEHFAFYVSDYNAPVVRERMEGFRTAVLAAKRQFHLIDYTPYLKQPDADKHLLPWLGQQLEKLPKPVGVMAQYDAEANDVVRACPDAGLRVPEDVAVVGVDNDPIYSELGPVPLSSVLSNREMIGYKGAELLDKLMRGCKPPAAPVRISPAGLVIRRSSDVFAIDDKQLRNALSYIAGHLGEVIEVKDLVSVSGASRRSLYLKFQQYLGRSIHAEIMRQRLNRAKQLLVNTDMKMQSIATECGFEWAEQLSRAFKMHEGTAPSGYRQNRNQ